MSKDKSSLLSRICTLKQKEIVLLKQGKENDAIETRNEILKVEEMLN